MKIDLSSFYRDWISEKLSLLRRAIDGCRRVAFRYFYEKGEAEKVLEPSSVVFKWSDWYVFGWSAEREDFRLYKLRRLWDLRVLEDSFLPRPVPEEKRRLGPHMTDDYMVEAVYEQGEKYRLVEEYGPHCFTVLPDGRLYARWGFTTPGRAVEWFLRFGDRVRVLSPPETVDRMKNEIEKMKRLYET